MSFGEFRRGRKRKAEHQQRFFNFGEEEDLRTRLNDAKIRRMEPDGGPGRARHGRGRGNQRDWRDNLGGRGGNHGARGNHQRGRGGNQGGRGGNQGGRGDNHGGRGDHHGGRGGNHGGRGGNRGGRRDRSPQAWRNRDGERQEIPRNNNFGRHFQRNDRENTEPEQHNQRRGNPNRNMDDNPRQRQNRKQYVGFKILEEISQCDSQDALTKLTQRKEAFIELLESPIDKPDMFIIIIECMAKVCQSSFDELKLNLVRDTCNSRFIASLKTYLVDLPYPESKRENSLYWNNPDSFWKNLLIFLESVITTSPTLALNKCRSLVEATSVSCLNSLKDRHKYNLPDEFENKFTDLRETMNNFEKKKEADQKAGKRCRMQDAEKPPENFRELSVMPTREDLLLKTPFLRPNITDGAYQDVEHYLDVQFRLLREDCFGPLRDGLGQYMQDQKKKRYDNIRVIHKVKFVKPYVSQTRTGSFVQVDLKENRNFKRINWNNSKRFIFGSLVLFTKDNCRNFLVGTILDRETKYLVEGLIPVSLMGNEIDKQLYHDDAPYTMIESEVYFEPYLHVLKALQDPSFPDHIAMKQYIVHVNPEPKPPSFLQPDTVFKVNLREDTKRQQILGTESGEEVSDSESETDLVMSLLDQPIDEPSKCHFTVLQDDTWPNKDMLRFNESQLDAYKLALTHEFAVIQGPPGTGKTYLGIKVAKTLYENMKKDIKGCLMLVICYTNHALDQFLEALLKVTPSIVRIGGQSRNEAMDPINLTKLRRNTPRSNANAVFFDQKMQLKEAVTEFQRAMVELDVLLNGVISIGYLEELDLQGIEVLREWYDARRGDVLYQWLFEYSGDYIRDVQDLLLEGNETNAFVDLEKEARRRTGVQLDEQDIEEEHISLRKGMASFTLEQTNVQINDLIVEYKNCQNLVQQHNYVLEIQQLNSLRECYKDMNQHRNTQIDMRITERTDPRRIAPANRWMIYFMWIQGLVAEKRQNIGILQGRVNAASTAHEEARMLLDMEVLRTRRIVGMTTSGAARMRKMLQALAPPIVIVEEAAEVLEQHIITSLTKDCSHLILIGDHQQLRPSASHMRLAKHYQIEVSLFERMINNGMHSRRLGVQHRMRPEIAALICPHIYPDLQNHPTVYDFPDVKGMTKNLFFFSHEHKEEEVVENQSRSNRMEADLVLALANYILQQGYSPEDVTILAAYKGQMFYMRKESDNYTHLRGVKITVVDNYQGEESKIILLSLVRNNAENKIGFLGTANRICVALSRAKEGFYIFGNIETLKANSELWQKIAATLEEGESLGTSITLKCQNHVNNLTEISKLEDFIHVPEGGCTARCEYPLRFCAHKCERFCHGYDRSHSTELTRCPKPCEKILCELGHVCPKKCFQECGPCRATVTKMLPCGHEMPIQCYLEPDDNSVKCHTLIEVTLPDCGHKAEKLCFVDIKKITCPVPCDYRVESCGHTCLRKCHVKDDPEHQKYLCKKKCARAKAGCTAELDGDRGAHQCINLCFETCADCTTEVEKKRSTCNHKDRVPCNVNIDEVPCKKKCSKKLPCDHFCKKKCFEKCGDCKEMVTKEIADCKHEVRMMCKDQPVRALCRQKCERIMRCGHKCMGICGDDCNPMLCNEPSVRKVYSPCGHLVTLPCRMAEMRADAIEESVVLGLCSEPCMAELACKHVCSGTCARCRQGRLHVACGQTCNQINICEHVCEEPCNQICPPCKKPCEVRCQHSRCRGQCGAPCTSCKERCERRCEHGGSCTRRCGEPCNRAPCEHACPLVLPCGHPCRGLCAEPCPPVCNRCHPDTFPTDFLGDPYDDDAKFVLLQDCGHVLEVEDMDSLMMGDSSTIEIKKCPFCRKPIINTGRYKDSVNKIFKKDINPIKIKIYGTDKQIQLKKKEIQDKIRLFQRKFLDVIKADPSIKSVFTNLALLSRSEKKSSLLHLDMQATSLEILELVATRAAQYFKDAATELKAEVSAQVSMICGVFSFRPRAGAMLKVSEQQQQDLKLEVQRLDALVQLARLHAHPSYAAARALPEVIKCARAARSAILSIARFVKPRRDTALQSLDDLQKACKLAGVVTRQEKDMIVRAMGMKAGHWYKCPNGHQYCIGECGGAMEESKCPACGAKIGGRNHTLTAGNAHDRDMDGSRFAAWSQEYNNMANFDM